MDHRQLASEVLRALRGRRSQPAFARRLGYRSNVSYLWEAGRAYPSFGATLDIARRVGVDLAQGFARFFGPGRAPAWLDEPERDGQALALSLLRELRQGMSLDELARGSGHSRFAVGRWLAGRNQPRLPQALSLIEACSLRVLDFVAALVDPRELPSFAPAYADLSAARRAAYDLPFSQVVLRALELREVAELPEHAPGFLAARLAVDVGQEQQCLQALRAAGQVRLEGARYRPTRVEVVDTRGSSAQAAALKRYFATLAVERIEDNERARSGYNVFAVSRADYARIAELQRDYFAQLRAIVARSEPAEVVALASTQLLALAE